MRILLAIVVAVVLVWLLPIELDWLVALVAFVAVLYSDSFGRRV